MTNHSFPFLPFLQILHLIIEIIFTLCVSSPFISNTQISQLLEELENLEETLNESIRESLGARTGKLFHGKKRGIAEEDEEDYIRYYH